MQLLKQTRPKQAAIAAAEAKDLVRANAAATDATTKADAAIATAAADATTKADAAEADAKTYADGLVATEASARSSAVTTLQNNINTRLASSA